MPDDWKRAIVSPIFKKGARNRAENYRPVSLTSILCKLMESFVKEVIVNHIMDKILIVKAIWIYQREVYNNPIAQVP